MNENVVPQPQSPTRSGAGCCGVGCLTLFLLIAFLAFAFVGGGFWAVHHLQNKYTDSEPVDVPEVTTSDAPASVDNIPSSPQTAPVAPRQVEEQWKTFEKAADRNEKARLELTAGQINALLQNSKNTRGKVSVSIENNVGHVHFSIPLKNVPMLKGRYLNGEATVEASPDGDPNKARISNIVLSKTSVSDGVMDQRLFGWTSMRGTISEWLNNQNIESFRIENNRVVTETGGTR